jgi:tetratricopeptide (TPR) repeat protein
MYNWTADGQRRSLRLVDDAIALVGEVPVLLAMKGQVFWNGANTNLEPADESLARAFDFASRALAIEPDLPLAIFVRGLVAGLRGRPEDALPDLYRAHALWPGDANVLCEVCRFSNVSGLRRHGDLIERVLQIDPLTPVTPSCKSVYHWLNGRHEDAVAPGRRAIAMAPAPSMLHTIMAWQLAEAGHREEASDILGRVSSALAGSPMGAFAGFLKGALACDADEARVHDTPEMRQALGNEFFARMAADACVLLGRRDEALEWLRRAIGRGLINHPCLAEHDRFLANLRTDHEFRRMMDELKPRWEAIVAWEEAREPAH